MNAEHRPLYLNDDLEDDATVVSPSPFGLDEVLTNPMAMSLPLAEAPTALAVGYPAQPAPVKPTFTEPLRGYPPGAAYVPQRLDQLAVPGSIVTGPTAVPATRVVAMAHARAVHHGAPVAAVGTGRLANRTVPMAVATDLRQMQASPVASPYLGAAATPQADGYADSGVRRSLSAALPAAPAAAFPATQAPAPGAAPYPAHGAVAAVPAAVAAVPAASAATQEPGLRFSRSVVATVVAALAGAVLWGGIGFITGGWEFKYAAVAIGALTGLAASRFAGGHSKSIGALGAVFGLCSILMGKMLFELLVQPHLTFGQHIAYHTTFVDLIFYAATAVTGFSIGAGMTNPRIVVARVRRLASRYLPGIG
ncbi:MAG: hypothetical protein DRJ42_16980 [Deltaproteobacteria bacterium]|nr:MAG: hypothetical protein DRJ42_16980 [Deltaproteobacteria bacterium]